MKKVYLVIRQGRTEAVFSLKSSAEEAVEKWNECEDVCKYFVQEETVLDQFIKG